MAFMALAPASIICYRKRSESALTLCSKGLAATSPCLSVDESGSDAARLLEEICTREIGCRKGSCTHSSLLPQRQRRTDRL
jgi:hypothetical protein